MNLQSDEVVRVNSRIQWIIMLFLFVLPFVGGIREVKANHETIPVLEGKVPFIHLECPFNDKGQLAADGAITKRCTLFAQEGNEDEFWAAVWNREAQLYTEVWRVPYGDKPNERVWKLEKPLTPRGGQQI